MNELISEFFWLTIIVAAFFWYCWQCLNHAPRDYRDHRE